MLGIVLANNFVMMFIFWELVGVSSYLLMVSGTNDRPRATRREGVYHESSGRLRFSARHHSDLEPDEWGPLNFRRPRTISSRQTAGAG